MKEIFKQLILDFHAWELPVPTPREMPPLTVPEGLRKAFVLVGMRRSGKTWALYEQMRRLLNSGTSREQLIYLNFEDDRLMGTEVSDLQGILDAYYELYPDADSSNVHFFFDEIHEVPHWERFIRRLLDTEKMPLYITGSSAKMLSKEIATSLRGRTLVREVFPYNFREFLTHLQRPPPKRLSSKQRAQLNHDALAYLRYGGFPEVVGREGHVQREILQGYIDTVIYRDIVERYNVSNVHVLRYVLTHCLQNPAAPFSVNKMYNSLKSQGVAISKNTLYSFLDYFSDAYCLFALAQFSLSSRKSAHKPRKLYPIDTGLITAYSIDSRYDLGPTLESLIFSHLLRTGGELTYYLTQGGLEVDFHLDSPGSPPRLVQVAAHLQDSKTRERELKALRTAMHETAQPQGEIITLDEKETLSFPEGNITITPLLDFLLA